MLYLGVDDIKPLIDTDILLWEIGVQGQYVDEESGETRMLSFDVVAEKFEAKVKDICAAVWATEPPLMFMSYNKQIFKNDEAKKAKQLKRVEREANKLKIKQLEEQLSEEECAAEMEHLSNEIDNLKPEKYNANFREAVAKKKVYKGNRKPDSKPLHYLNLVEYVKANYECVMAKGLEADDLLGVYQMRAEPLTTVICSRDKDLKIIPGMHYGWEAGFQREFGPVQVDEVGEISLNARRNKVSGSGLKFFYSQVLTGDVTDNYPGLPSCGPVKAFNTLSDTNTEGEMFEAVLGAYRETYTKLDGEEHDYRAEMLEQCRLAYMIQELDEEDNIVPYIMFDERGQDE